MNKKSVVSSLLFKFAERLSVKSLGLIISVVLARILAPSEFGQVAIIMVFINLSQTFVQAGLGTALIQSKDLNDDDYSTVFYISLATSVLFIIILYFAAPFIGRYYNNSGMVTPLRVYSLSLIFAALNSVQSAKLQREMKFKIEMICSLIAVILSGIIGITLAVKGAGIWALIAYYFSNMIIICLIMTVALKWFPRLVFSLKRAKSLFTYGWKMLVSALLCSIYNDIRSLIIGKMFSDKDLGYYDRGNQFSNIVSLTLDSAIQSVMFPVVSRNQDSTDAVRRITRKSASLSAFVTVPIMFGIAAVARPLISFLLTDKWLPCVIYLQILCIGNAFMSIESALLVAIKAIGRSDVYVKLETARRIIMLIILAISIICFKSVKAIAYGFSISFIVDVIVISFPVKRLINYSIGELIGDIWKPILSATVMFFAAFSVSFLNLSDIILLLIQVPVGVAVYLLMNYILRFDGMNYCFNTLKSLIKKDKVKQGE